MINRFSAVILVSLLYPINVVAEPWLDPSNALLRSDIERLSSAGIINTPINTWPLMWANILDHIDSADVTGQPQSIIDSYARVKGKESAQLVSIAPTNRSNYRSQMTSQVLRHFGNSVRDEGQLTLFQQGSTQHLAYKLEVSQVQDPWDNESSHFDNSYLAMALGNWVLGVGAVERWWGPGWNTSLILSNNARPTTSLFFKEVTQIHFHCLS